MPKKPVQFGEWRPDIAELDTDFASDVENVFPGVNSYKPFPSLFPFSAMSLSNAGNDSFTKVLLHFDGADASTTITDVNIGGSAHVWAVAGNAQIDTAQAQFGVSSLLLDGTGDWVTTPDHADFALGSSDFTIDCWFNCDDVSGILRHIAGQCDNAGSRGSTSFQISRLITNTIRVTVSTGSGLANAFACTGTTQFTSSTNTGWHHLAFVRQDINLKLFIDGVLEATNVIAGAINNSTNALRIGALGETTIDTWKGWIDEFRISVGLARWTQNFPPPRGTYFDAGGRVCGLTAARTASGTWKIYAGTTGKLVMWTAAGWVDVSRTVGGAYNVSPDALWSFAQFGTKLIAVNINDVPQVIDIDSGTNFTALGGSPPFATTVYQLGDFLFLSGLAGTIGTSGTPPAVNKRMIAWSGINAIETWNPATNLCDTQEFPDNGPVQGVSGGEIGYVVQDRGIRTCQFLPGDTTYVFSFSRILHDRGCISRYGYISIGNVLYFVSEDGFYAIAGQSVTPIGADKVNDWFLANSDVTRRDRIQAFSFVNKPRIGWAFHSFSGSPTYDRLLIYDWSNQRWAPVMEQAQVWATLASTDLDLDTDGAELGDALLDSAALSLDSFAYVGGRPLIGAIDENGMLSSLAGPNLKARMETAEHHLMPGMRTFVSDAYPLVDGLAETVTAGTRERLQDAVVWETPAALEVTGSAAVYSSARLHRFRVEVPLGATWSHAQGVVVEAQQDGTVA